MSEQSFASDRVLCEAAVAALKSGLEQACPSAAFDPQYPAYVADERDNFLRPEVLEEFRAQFDHGAGGELKPRWRSGKKLPAKMKAVRSSSAMALNLFGRWRQTPRQLVVGPHTRLGVSAFEHRLPAVSGRHPPHLDVSLQDGNTLLGIEVKCLEYLSRPKNEFAEAYRQIRRDDPRRASPWFAHMDAARDYKRLHTAQLIKHYFGLAAVDGSARTLFYLYWLPSNWQDISVRSGTGTPVNPFRQHRDEIRKFAEAVANDAATGIRFESMSTLDLLEQWSALKEPAWLRDYLAALEARYAVAITNTKGG